MACDGSSIALRRRFLSSSSQSDPFSSSSQDYSPSQSGPVDMSKICIALNEENAQNSTSSTQTITAVKIERLEKQISYEFPKYDDYIPLKQLYHFGMKGGSLSNFIKEKDPFEEAEEEYRLKKLDDYGGAKELLHTIVRTAHARSLLENLKSSSNIPYVNFAPNHIEGLCRIYQNRLLQLYWCQRLELALNNTEQMESIITDVINNINSLDDPSSDQVITLENGTTCFSILAGCIGHVVCYVFIKSREGYTFTIDDRSSTNSAVATAMRSSHLDRQVKYGRFYIKSSLSIRTTKEALTNRAFIQSILRKKSPTIPYAEISLLLTKIYPGEIVVSKIEPLLERLFEYERIIVELNRSEKDSKLYSLLGKIETISTTLIKRDDYFHSIQPRSTCAHTNTTGIEKLLADYRMIKYEKHHTLVKTEKHVKEHLKSLESMPDSHTVYTKMGQDFPVRRNKSQLNKDGELIISIAQNMGTLLWQKFMDPGSNPRPNLESAISNAQILLEELNKWETEFKRSKESLWISTINNISRPYRSPTRLVDRETDLSYYLGLLPESYKKNASFMLQILREAKPKLEAEDAWNPKLVQLVDEWMKALPPDLRMNEEFILEAVDITSIALKAADDRLKASPGFMGRAQSKNPWTLIYASSAIRTNAENIKLLPCPPQNENYRENFLDEVPEDLSRNPYFKQKLNSNSHCCVIL